QSHNVFARWRSRTRSGALATYSSPESIFSRSVFASLIARSLLQPQQRRRRQQVRPHARHGIAAPPRAAAAALSAQVSAPCSLFQGGGMPTSEHIPSSFNRPELDDETYALAQELFRIVRAGETERVARLLEMGLP